QARADHRNGMPNGLDLTRQRVNRRVQISKNPVTDGEILPDRMFQLSDADFRILQFCKQVKRGQSIGRYRCLADDLWLAEKIPLIVIKSQFLAVFVVLV